MEEKSEKNIVITDSGFGGLSVLAAVYENLRHEKFPLHLSFAEALPKNCPGYPWQGYSLMPDRKTKVKVFHNFLTGLEKHFRPDRIALVCNTLSAIVQETDYYARNREKIINIIDTGLEECSRLEIEDRACIIILGTQTTVSSDIHRRGLAEKGIFPHDRILPIAFAPEDHYPLRIETEPESAGTWDISQKTLEKAFPFIPDSGTPVYVYLGCTHFGFVQHHYIRILQKAGFGNVKIINPNQAMTEKLTTEIRKIYAGQNRESSLVSNGIRTEIYSQFLLSPEQISSGAALIAGISPTVSRKLKEYIFKNDITEKWEE